MKNMYFIIISAFCMIYVILIVRKKKFSIQESFWWFIASFAMLMLSIFPYSINWLAGIFHIAYPPSLLFVFCIIFLVFVNFRNSKKIAEQQEKIIELSQHIAILESEKDERK